MTILKDMTCGSCGRDFDGDEILKPGDNCPAYDDCPSHWEEKGREHPQHPAEKGL